MFESYGKIGDIYIPRNTREGGNRGFGFVRFFQQEDAEAALKENGQSLHGATIQVTIAEARPPRRELIRCYVVNCVDVVAVAVVMDVPDDTVVVVLVIVDIAAAVAVIVIADTVVRVVAMIVRIVRVVVIVVHLLEVVVLLEVVAALVHRVLGLKFYGTDDTCVCLIKNCLFDTNYLKWLFWTQMLD